MRQYFEPDYTTKHMTMSLNEAIRTHVVFAMRVFDMRSVSKEYGTRFINRVVPVHHYDTLVNFLLEHPESDVVVAASTYGVNHLTILNLGHSFCSVYVNDRQFNVERIPSVIR